MVDALRETWRVLVPDGTLLDLRPTSSKYPIEVVTPTEEVQVGEFDGYGAAADDAAADRAVRHVVEDGWFIPRLDCHFDIAFYWDTISEMAFFMEESRRVKQVIPSCADLEKAHGDLCAGAGAKARLRCRRPMMLSVYHKTELGERS